ncbi:BCCT family transporter [Candidatus Riflebacteria bacterium]
MNVQKEEENNSLEIETGKPLDDNNESDSEPEICNSSKKGFSVFYVSLFICGIITLWGLIKPEHICLLSKRLTDFCLASLDWFFLASCTLFTLVCFYLALSQYGSIKLGKQHELPEFSTISWLSMLFAAGMGCGLLFWGVAQPLVHFVEPPFGIDGLSEEAARQALVLTNFSWGIHAWGIYAIGALCLAYYSYRKGYPLLCSSPIRSSFSGQFGIVLGNIADVVAVVSVVFGVAGSLGMGVIQLNAGLNQVFSTPTDSLPLMLSILFVLTICYMISAGTSLDKGIQFLSNLNIAIAVILMLFILFFGPTGFILSTFVTSIGEYASKIVNLSFYLAPFGEDTEWIRSWPLTYFMWWVAWVPFVGIFIARISRGRTIREFIFAVIFLPSLFTMLWFSIFGGCGLHVELFGDGGLALLAVDDVSKALFVLFEFFPIPKILSVVSLCLVFIFLVTSADSASYVLGTMTTEGSMDPPTYRKLFWGITISLLTASTLFGGGGVRLMRSIAIVGAIPFIIVMIVQVACLLTCLRHEKIIISTDDQSVAGMPAMGEEV